MILRWRITQGGFLFLDVFQQLHSKLVDIFESESENTKCWQTWASPCRWNTEKRPKVTQRPPNQPAASLQPSCSKSPSPHRWRSAQQNSELPSKWPWIRAIFRQKLVKKHGSSWWTKVFIYVKVISSLSSLFSLTCDAFGFKDEDLLLLVEDVDIGSRVLPGRAAEDLIDNQWQS